MPVTVQALINGSKGGRFCVELSKHFNRYFHRYPIFIGSLINLNDLINRTHPPRAGFRQALDQTGCAGQKQKVNHLSRFSLLLQSSMVDRRGGTASNAMRAEIATG